MDMGEACCFSVLTCCRMLQVRVRVTEAHVVGYPQPVEDNCILPA